MTKPEEEPTSDLARASIRGGYRFVAVWNGGSLIRQVPTTGSLVVGRGEDVDLRVDHTSVSRRHAVLHLDPLAVEDLGSSNGTWISGRRIEPRQRAQLASGALLEIGSVMIMLQVPSVTPASRSPSQLVGVDPAMRRLAELVDVVAQSNISVLIVGETGAGKDVVASQIHARSPRAAKPFVRLNCAALPEALLEGELFGHERGAFTGAVAAKAGLLESADGGTVFLDEVGEMPLATQAKLLRALESGEVLRLGALKPRNVDVRFVAATNRDLREAVDAGRFRADLVFRLDGITIAVPPLRERPGDIPALAEAFVVDACARAARAPLRVPRETLAALAAHAWPGNVRELKNVIARSVLLATGDVLAPEMLRFESALGAAPRPPASTPRAFPIAPSAPTIPVPALASGDADERTRVLAALEQCAGNQTKAAKLLGISRRTLVHKLDIYGVPRPRK
ncbi:MAG TPA: sigma 54-interacting transcriptional regulator [Labilithrix sp.]|jgi:transcriptional regulator with GAF, ATPase, and Fis domain